MPASDMNRYVAHQNVRRFENMLAVAGTEEDRTRLCSLLDEAYAALEATRTPNPVKGAPDTGR
ncbi:hypothetical protein [Phenylobacterium sp.]|uniref:hypothetical protein n=1 Tax=Phenylobacterium sp. TaxID=1871053 RepID=UPI003BA9EAAF